MSREDVTINRSAVTTIAHHGDVNMLCGLYRESRRTMIRLDLGPFDTPADNSHIPLAVTDPVGTLPSLRDIVQWLDSLYHESDSEDDSDSDDDSVDELEFLCRLYKTLDDRVPPTYKAAVIAAE